MRLFFVIPGLALLLPVLAHADLVLNGRSTVTAMGMQGAGVEKFWLSQSLIRRDMVDRGKAYSNIFDLKAREVTVLDHSLRQATIYATHSLKEQTDAAVDSKAIKLDVKPTGRTHNLQKWRCAEHDMNLSMPAEIGGEKLTFEMKGQVWLARNTKEQKEIAGILRLMQNPDFFLGIPALAKASPVQARGISEAIRRVAPMGLLCSVDVALNYDGAGRVATLSRKLASRLSLTFDDYSVEAVPKESFDIPGGYRIQRQ